MKRIRCVLGTALMFGWGTLATAGFGFEFGDSPAACKPVKACAPVTRVTPLPPACKPVVKVCAPVTPLPPACKPVKLLAPPVNACAPVKTCEPVHEHLAALHGHLVALLHPTWWKGHAWKHGVVDGEYTAPQLAPAAADPAPIPIAPKPPTPGKA